jgi:hypothetical protein
LKVGQARFARFYVNRMSTAGHGRTKSQRLPDPSKRLVCG